MAPVVGVNSSRFVLLHTAHAEGADANESATGLRINDIGEAAGQAIIGAMLEGERDPQQLVLGITSTRSGFPAF
jgi:hypothetical protein